MGELAWLHLFLFFLLQCQVAYSSSSSSHRLCLHDQSSALLQFVSKFTNPKTLSWNESSYSDCCLWNGVTCDMSTGHVIGLDLSCSNLYGTIHPNSTLFQLSHLRRLNLAYNDFNSSSIPSAFGRFASLTYLNLSYSGFSGSIPTEIHHLSKLVSLDLAVADPALRLEHNNFKKLFQNLTQLRELFLPMIGINSVVPDSLMNLSSLTSLDLSYTGLQGKLPHNIFQLLPNLQSLLLGGNNDLTGNLPPQVFLNGSSSSSLKELDLSYTSFSGELPDSIGYLKSLNYLRLFDCEFSRYVPQSLGNLSKIVRLDLWNNDFIGKIPSTLSNLEQLTHLDLSNNKLEGQIPDAFAKLGKLEVLDLSSNYLKGRFPSSVANLTALATSQLGYNAITGPIPLNISGLQNLIYLDFSNIGLTGRIPANICGLPRLEWFFLSNNELTGPIPSNISGLQNLLLLDFSNNSLNGTIPSGLFTLPSLETLELNFNRLTDFSSDDDQLTQNNSALKFIDLSDNVLHGPIPQSISNLVNLTHLNLSSNNLSGVMELHIFSNLKKLESLDLSGNNIAISTRSDTNVSFPNLLELYLSSCNINEFPDFLRYSKNLYHLDLSNNKIHGHIPKWLGDIGLTQLNLSRNFLTDIEQLPWKQLYLLDLHSNKLRGQLPVPPLTTAYYFISHNNLTGEIPPLICGLTSLEILDLSHNNLSGAIPQCLGNFSNVLSVLDLQSNGFHGTIPLSFAKGNSLRNLDFNGNQLEGPLPRSLSNCKHLEVLDLGNNKINSTFPNWLGTLPELQVLVLRSNRFHGPIVISKIKLPFPKLRIIDLSHNEFSGHLPARCFKIFRAMKNVNGTITYPGYMGDKYGYYQDSVAVTLKGLDIKLEHILTIFTTIDLSVNKFIGEIPDVIGRLNALLLLNLSHNSLTGRIPKSFGNLSMLESLDLSSNQLTGKIPRELTNLTFLEVLNVSSNHLDGSIPQGKQFNTFSNDSYVGNLGLCGFPLLNECGDSEAQPQPPFILQEQDDSDFTSGFTWKAVMMGYGCGLVFGLFIGYVLFLIGRPKWLVRIVEGKQHRRAKRSKRLGYGWDGRRNHHT